MEKDNSKIYTSKSLAKELNEERKAKGLYELPEVNCVKGGNTSVYARKEKSFKSAVDFYNQLIKSGKKEK